jgi:tetratricopeptide (TPR) repeat protein
MTKKKGRRRANLAQRSDRILSIIFSKRFDEAQTAIADAYRAVPTNHHHRLIALRALLRWEMGNSSEAIELMQQALGEKPDWIPHLYRLSVMLMDMERWSEAYTVLSEAISLSEQRNDAYFLDDALIRKIICAKAMGRYDEVAALKAKITPGAGIFIADKRWTEENPD